MDSFVTNTQPLVKFISSCYQNDNQVLSEVAALIKNSKSTHPIILIFSLLLLTLSLILPCNSNANPLIKTGDINNNGLVNLEDVVTEHATLRDCIKVSTQLTGRIRKTGDIIYYWFYKGVKESSSEKMLCCSEVFDS
jgi:hypothetical protein